MNLISRVCIHYTDEVWHVKVLHFFKWSYAIGSNNANTVTQMSLVRILLCTSHCSSYQHVEHNSSIHDVMVSLADVIIRVNLQTTNVNYSWRTTPLTSKVAFYIFIQQIEVLNILNMIYTLHFFLFKMQFVS